MTPFQNSGFVWPLGFSNAGRGNTGGDTSLLHSLFNGGGAALNPGGPSGGSGGGFGTGLTVGTGNELTASTNFGGLGFNFGIPGGAQMNAGPIGFNIGLLGGVSPSINTGDQNVNSALNTGLKALGGAFGVPTGIKDRKSVV